MGKLSKTFSAVGRILKNPWLLNLIVDQNSVWEEKVVYKYQRPNGLPQVELDDLFPHFSVELTSFSFLGGGSLPTDIALLKLLCAQKPNSSYFEIGTWRGESVKNVSETAKECYTLNLSKADIVALGLSEKYANAHAFFSKDLPNVIHLEGDSRTFDYAGLGKKFDVIFIDGNHHFDFVKSDTKNVFDHLMHEESVVVWHDYAYSPDDVRFEIMHAILDAVPAKEHSNLYHVANTMCALYTKKKFPAQLKEKYDDPLVTFELKMRSKQL